MKNRLTSLLLPYGLLLLLHKFSLSVISMVFTTLTAESTDPSGFVEVFLFGVLWFFSFVLEDFYRDEIRTFSNERHKLYFCIIFPPVTLWFCSFFGFFQYCFGVS